jgi:hypothetical protein
MILLSVAGQVESWATVRPENPRNSVGNRTPDFLLCNAGSQPNALLRTPDFVHNVDKIKLLTYFACSELLVLCSKRCGICANVYKKLVNKSC